MQLCAKHRLVRATLLGDPPCRCSPPLQTSAHVLLCDTEASTKTTGTSCCCTAGATSRTSSPSLMQALGFCACQQLQAPPCLFHCCLPKDPQLARSAAAAGQVDSAHTALGAWLAASPNWHPICKASLNMLRSPSGHVGNHQSAQAPLAAATSRIGQSCSPDLLLRHTSWAASVHWHFTWLRPTRLHASPPDLRRDEILHRSPLATVPVQQRCCSCCLHAVPLFHKISAPSASCPPYAGASQHPNVRWLEGEFAGARVQRQVPPGRQE